MSLVSVINLCLMFTGRELFNRIGFQVERGERIGLVGPNGSGKTSLLRLLAGEISPDKGEIRLSSRSRIGYLPQDISERLKGPLLRAVLDSVPGRESIMTEIKDIEESSGRDPAEGEHADNALRLTELHNELDFLDLQFPEHRAEKILEGLGFYSAEFIQPVSTLSGGWKMRAALGSLLYQAPDLLLLDEPTNHLDIPSVRWLEKFIREYKGAIILVSHDRDFLNRQIGRVISLEPEGVRIYRGNYDQYVNARAEEQKTLEAAARNQEQKTKEAKKFIERFRAKATKARQAQSKIKLLKKMEMVRSLPRQKSIRFAFPDVPRSGRAVLSIQNISKGYGKKSLFKGIDLTVLRGERVAVIGPNGIGKTTLLKIVAGEIDADEGSILLGHNVDMSYYAQHHSEMLDLRKTVIEEVYQVVPQETIGLVRSLCGAFLFSGDDVDKPVKVLSGGEKARVSLAKILVKPGNFIVMDEPTNHLDLISSELLIDALSGFKGSLLFVSHNQSFVNRLATKIWDIGDGGIIEYPGKLYEYYRHLEKREITPSDTLPQKAAEKGYQGSKKPDGIKENRRAIRKKKAQERNLLSSRLKPFIDRLSRLEDRIAELETREREISRLLTDPDLFKDEDKSLPLLKEYGLVKEELEESMLRWEENQDRLQKLKADLGVPDQS